MGAYRTGDWPSGRHTQAYSVGRMLRILVDTSTWLDLAKRRDGQKWIVILRLLVRWNRLQVVVPTVVAEEFSRNRARGEASMTASVAERFRLLKADLDQYGGDDEVAGVVTGLAYQVPLVGALTSPEISSGGAGGGRGVT